MVFIIAPFTLILASVLTAILFIYKFVTGKPSKNFPPGPVRLPVFGSYLHVLWEDQKYAFKAFEQLKFKYGSPLIGCYIGNAPTIIANDYATCRAILSKPEFQGRTEGYPVVFRTFGKQLGLFAGEGWPWQHTKRFSLMKMRDLGFGRRSPSYEAVLSEEVGDLISHLEEESFHGRSVLIPDLFYPPLFNCILHLMIGARYPVSEHETLKTIGRASLEFVTSNNVTGEAVSILPWLRHFPPTGTRFGALKRASDYLENFMKGEFRKHEESFDKEYLRDMMDNFLKHKDEEVYFTDEQILITSIDFLFPNAAVSVALSFALVYLILNPTVQEKCQRQIDDIVGSGRLPNLDDRARMPYVEATLKEVLRRQTVTPLSLGHKATEDSEFFGYQVPKDTFIIQNLWSMNMDRSFWGDPENFRPERFLDGEGRIITKEMSFPFGVGKRVCVGETFARQNMFVVLSAILQRFNISACTKIDFSKNRYGVALAPQPDLRVMFSPRK